MVSNLLTENCFDAIFQKISILSMGPLYYYVIDADNGVIECCSESIKDIHGLSRLPDNEAQIEELIQNEDKAYVKMVNNTIMEHVSALNITSWLQLKISYFIQMQHADGSLPNFLRQQFILSTNAEGTPKLVMFVHTYINHILPRVNKCVNLKLFGSKIASINISLSNQTLCERNDKLTKRESEILNLLIAGFDNGQIASQLYISSQTVQTHRKKLLKKTNSANTHILLRKCRAFGVL